MSARSGIDDEDLPRVLKLLERVGFESKPKEFEETLNKFKQHPEALKALRKGVARQGRSEDSGSYCESPSRGYGDWVRKSDLLDKLDLEDDRAFLNSFNAANLPRKGQGPKAADDTLEQLQAQVRELTDRIESLERRAIRGPVVKPNL